MIQLLTIVGPLVINLAKEVGKAAVEKVTEKLVDKMFEKGEKKNDKKTTDEKKGVDKTASPSNKSNINVQHANGSNSNSSHIHHNSEIQRMNVTHIAQQIDSGAFAVQLSSALQGEFESLKNQIASMQVAKLNAAFSFLHRALIDLESFFNDRNKPLREHEIDRAMSWIRQANTNATEAFFDKANVSIEGRKEAMQLMLFCSALEYYDDHRKIISSWTRNIHDYLRDQEISAVYKGELKEMVSKDNKSKYAPLPLQEIFGNLAISVDSFTECNPSLAKDRDNFFALLNRPSFISTNDEALVWTKAKTYFTVPNGPSMPICIDKATRGGICALPNHLYARLVAMEDRHSLQIINVWTKGIIVSLRVPFEKEYLTWRPVYLLAYDLIMLFEMRTRAVTYYKFDGKKIVNASNKQTADLPKKLPIELITIDEKSLAFLEVDGMGENFFGLETSDTEKEANNYMWSNQGRTWQKINLPTFHTIRCVRAVDDGSFVAVVRARDTNDNFLAGITFEGICEWLTPIGIRNESFRPIFSSDYRYIISLAKIYDQNKKLIRNEVDMYDASSGKLIANEKLPNAPYFKTLDICQIAGRIIIADLYTTVPQK